MIRPNTSINCRLALVKGVVPAKALAQRPGLLVIIGRQYDVARASGGTVAVRTGSGRARAPEHSDVHGTPEEVLSQLLAFGDAGASEFIVRDDAANVPLGQALAQIDNLGRAVLPRLTR
jgi:alkanesulfonate monooxygenase SsuD/methylene tetrahydromethanopterin reductase-like flavin-dependent oxidoreductase (luciferase family)